MLRTMASPRSALRLDSKHHPKLAAGHGPQLCGMVHDWVHCTGDEVHEHDFNDWPATDDGGADAGANKAGLRDRRIADPLRAELLLEALGRPEHPAVGAELFAHQERARIRGQGAAERLP